MFTYIIVNSKDQLYVGITKDLSRQIRDHNKGRIEATKAYAEDWKQLHVWSVDGYLRASKLKRYLNTVSDVIKRQLVQKHSVFDSFLEDKLQRIPATAYELKQEE